MREVCLHQEALTATLHTTQGSVSRDDHSRLHKETRGQGVRHLSRMHTKSGRSTGSFSLRFKGDEPREQKPSRLLVYSFPRHGESGCRQQILALLLRFEDMQGFVEADLRK